MEFGDIRKITHENRVRLGFPEETSWREAPAIFSMEALRINGHPVMESWEDSYMEELARIAASQGGKVLEVGFGMGLSARHIQAQPIESHLIIECNKNVYSGLKRFAEKALKPVVPLLGFWQEVTKAIPDGSFSGILFDTYPTSEKEIHKNHFDFFPEAFRLLKPGGAFTYYSDEINDFGEEHLRRLKYAGFSKIDKKICSVTPPKDCEYWKSPTILAPIIIK